MRLKELWLLFLPALSMGLRWDTIIFAVNYFKGRNVPHICLLTCANVAWDVKFAKAASSSSLSVSKLNSVHLSTENMNQCFRQHYSTVGVLMDSRCETSKQVLYAASKNRWLDLMHIWLIIHENETAFKDASASNVSEDFDDKFSKNLQILNNMNISVDADIIMASRYDDEFKLLDVFNFGKVQGGDLITTEVRAWNPEEDNTKLFQMLNEYKFYRRYDFKQLGIRIISVALSETFDPKMLTEIRPVKGVAPITRASTSVLAVVAEIHNIRFVHTRSDKWLGSYDSNVSRAVAAALYFEEQDVTSVFRHLESLLKRVTLIHPSLISLETRYYYRIPSTGPGKFENQFLRPLSTGTWYCLLAVSALCVVILVRAARLESRPSALQYALFSVTASICQQFFADDTPEMILRRTSAARRITIFVTGMSCVLVYNYYTSSVVSWLLNAPPPSITSLDELVQSPLEIIFEDVGYTHSWLTVPGYYFNTRNARSEDIIRKRALSNKRKTPLFVPLEQGIAMVKAGGYAYLTEPYSADPVVSQTFDMSELCELGSLPSIEKVYLYPGVQRNSPYKEFLTWSLTRMLERGIISCVQRRTIPQPVRCEGSTPRALALGGAAPAFILLGLHYLLSIGIMLLERLLFKQKRRQFHIVLN